MRCGAVLREMRFRCWKVVGGFEREFCHPLVDCFPNQHLCECGPEKESYLRIEDERDVSLPFQVFMC